MRGYAIVPPQIFYRPYVRIFLQIAQYPSRQQFYAIPFFLAGCAQNPVASGSNPPLSQAVDALDAPDRASDRDILTDLARNIISTARLYGLDTELAPARKRADKED